MPLPVAFCCRVCVCVCGVCVCGVGLITWPSVVVCACACAGEGGVGGLIRRNYAGGKGSTTENVDESSRTRTNASARRINLSCVCACVCVCVCVRVCVCAWGGGLIVRNNAGEDVSAAERDDEDVVNINPRGDRRSMCTHEKERYKKAERQRDRVIETWQGSSETHAQCMTRHRLAPPPAHAPRAPPTSHHIQRGPLRKPERLLFYPYLERQQRERNEGAEGVDDFLLPQVVEDFLKQVAMHSAPSS